MFPHLERPPRPLSRLTRVWSDIDSIAVVNGLIGWLFSATGPIAIILAIGEKGGLSEAALSSWIFGIFFFNGVITILLSWLYREPLAHFWTIPGTILIGPALQHLSFAEVIGAYYVSGLLMIALGATGWVRRAMEAMPMPIVMGMVAGVFLRFGLDLVRAVHGDVAIAGPMVATWLALNVFMRAGRYIPPIIGALIVGAAASLALGRIDLGAVGAIEIARPMLQTPAWSWAALVELVIPLSITVLVVQNGQGFAVLRNAGHEPPVDTVTVACGVGTLFSAMVGGVCTCLAGPTNALLTSSGRRERHYAAALVSGVLSIVFSLLAPAFTRFMLNAPKSFIMTLAGLAMLRVLQSAFTASFKDKFALGALLSFIITVSDINIFNIGAAFWGLIFSSIISFLIENKDWHRHLT